MGQGPEDSVGLYSHIEILLYENVIVKNFDCYIDQYRAQQFWSV